MAEIKAVIFDWGGVLIEDPAPGLMRYCAEALGVTVAQYREAHGRYQDNFQKGLVEESLFWEQISEALGRAVPDRESLWGDAFRAVYAPREEMFELVRSLRRGGCLTALLSNTEVPAMRHFHTFGYDMFDVQVFSCAEGTRKPEREIYQRTVRRLGIEPDEAVFIDDSPDYIAGARSARLGTVLFGGIDETKRQLMGPGVMALSRQDGNEQTNASAE